jgi:hypothetical protein
MIFESYSSPPSLDLICRLSGSNNEIHTQFMRNKAIYGNHYSLNRLLVPQLWGILSDTLLNCAIFGLDTSKESRDAALGSVFSV